MRREALECVVRVICNLRPLPVHTYTINNPMRQEIRLMAQCLIFSTPDVKWKNGRSNANYRDMEIPVLLIAHTHFVRIRPCSWWELHVIRIHNWIYVHHFNLDIFDEIFYQVFFTEEWIKKESHQIFCSFAYYNVHLHNTALHLHKSNCCNQGNTFKRKYSQ